MNGEYCPACRSPWSIHELDEFAVQPDSSTLVPPTTAKMRLFVTCLRGHRFEAQTVIGEINRGTRYEGLTPA